jgi:histidinol phosphatase-like PHP family hydrolase
MEYPHPQEIRNKAMKEILDNIETYKKQYYGNKVAIGLEFTCYDDKTIINNLDLAAASRIVVNGKVTKSRDS